jgi:hypothetical protein
VLSEAFEEKRFTLIEIPLAKGDVSPILRGFATAFGRRLSALGSRGSKAESPNPRAEL